MTNQASATRFVEVLEDEGFTVKTVASGEACLTAVEREVFACILLDIWLGKGIDGLETLKRLRENGNDSAVIMISGHGNIETAVKSTKLGAFDFIEKPLSLEKTVVTVKNAVRQRELERANRQMIDESNREVRDGRRVGGDACASEADRDRRAVRRTGFDLG
jgi:two-component system nitrogen regulation response regulator NtrX